jgi:chromatin assembly factor 1 subunit A
LPEKVTKPGSDENQMASRKPGRPKATADPGKAVEKAAKVGLSIFTILLAHCFPYSLKEKDRTGKKAAKAEKERKDKESQEKARSLMASFFGKPKPSSPAISPSKGTNPSASNTLPEFDRVFRPFTLKKGAELAPTNWFRDAKIKKQHANAEVIVIDEDHTEDPDVEMSEAERSPGASTRRNISFIRLLAISLK